MTGFRTTAEPTQGAQGVWSNSENRLIPLAEYQDRQRARLADARLPPPSQPPPRNDRAELETALIDALHRRVGTAAKATKSDAALSKAIAVAEDARRHLIRIEREDAEHNANLGDHLREWIAGGAEGERPRAHDCSPAERRSRQAAETDLAAASAAIGALEKEFAAAKAADDDAVAAVHDAARSILSEEALTLAERIEVLETEAAELWHAVWGLAFAHLPGGKPLHLHPLVLATISAPPRRANRTGLPLARKTAQGQQAIEAARARFERLVAGEPEPAPPEAP